MMHVRPFPVKGATETPMLIEHQGVPMPYAKWGEQQHYPIRETEAWSASVISLRSVAEPRTDPSPLGSNPLL